LKNGKYDSKDKSVQFFFKFQENPSFSISALPGLDRKKNHPQLIGI
jgi:hypothetical protein